MKSYFDSSVIILRRIIKIIIPVVCDRGSARNKYLGSPNIEEDGIVSVIRQSKFGNILQYLFEQVFLPMAHSPHEFTKVTVD